MPRISVTIEADTQEEYLSLLAGLMPMPVTTPRRQQDNWAGEPKDPVPTPESVPAPVEADSNGQVVHKEPEQPAEEKKARKPRAPKMKPVTEDAPEEAEEAADQSSKPGKSTANGNGEVMTDLDLKDAIGEYILRFGVNFGSVDISKTLQETFGPDVRKRSQVPQTPEGFGKAVAAVRALTAENPHNRKVEANG